LQVTAHDRKALFSIRCIRVTRSHPSSFASRDVVVRVAGGTMPASWRRTGLDAAASELLAQLRASTPQEIAGVASVPAVELPVAGTAASRR